jgi:ribosomal protein S18 acetylase RimI-like enzyme
VTTGDAVPVVELGDADRDGAIALWEACGLTRPWNPPVADFDRAVTGGTSAVLGIVANDEVVATAMVGHDGHRGWVYYLAVDPERRGSGLGRTLMTAAEQWLRTAGVPKVQLMVRTSNEAVQAFYARLGYEDQETVVLGRWLHDD